MKRATIVLALLFAVTGAVAGGASAVDASPTTAVRLSALDHAILTRLNATRVSHGLRPLALSVELQDAAVAHSRSMLEGGFFSHDSRDGSSFATRIKRFYRATGFSAWSAGENLIYNTAELDAAAAIEAWLASPAHRDNMLAPEWREVGIGSLHAASAGGTFGGEPTWVVTVDFGVRAGAGKAAKPAVTVTSAKAKAKLGKAAAPSKRRVERVLPLPA